MRKCYVSLCNVTTKILLPVAFLLFASLNLRAQTDITIGTGTAGNGNTYPAPLQDWYEGSRAQFLYKASELMAAGMSPGNINAIKFNVTNLNGSGVIEQLTIKIGTTTATTLNQSAWENVNTTVYGPTDYTPTAGANTFTFPAPFFWNGTDNIVVETCNGDPNSSSGTTYTANATVPWTTGLSFNGSHSYQEDNVGYACGTTNTAGVGTNTATSRPNITFTWTSAVPCSGAPNPGTVSPASATLCVGGSFTFTATGVTVASGLTYQWQISDNATGPFTDISGATALSYTSNLAQNKYYRFKVICNLTDSSFSNVVVVNTGTIASGTYTIDNANPTNPGARTFNNFNDAYNFIKCGISAPVIFNVVNNAALPPGVYNEQLIMNAVPGADATNTVTFKGNGSTIKFAPATTSINRATIKLDSASFITFDSLVIRTDTAAGGAGYGVQFRRNSDYNTIIRCVVSASTTSPSPKYAGIVFNTNDTGYAATGRGGSDFNRIDSNIINGGFYSIVDVGSTNVSSAGNGHNEIKDNFINDFYQYGYYATNTFFENIEHNVISRPTRAVVGPFYGVYFTGGSSSALVQRNRIMNPFGGNPLSTGAFYGIDFESVTVPSGGDFFVQNNCVMSNNGNGIVQGITDNASPSISFIHNTVNIDNATSTSTQTTRGFSNTGTATSLVFYNNIVYIKRGGTGTKYGLYFGTPANAIASDYNDVYIDPSTTNASFGYYTAARATLTAWQAASGQDANSFSTDPIFVAGSCLPQSAVIDGGGFPLGIPDDMDYHPRPFDLPPNGPDLGCLEFIPPNCVAPPTAGTTIMYGDSAYADTVCYGTLVPLGLIGNSSGFTQQYWWEASPTQTGTYVAIDTPRISPDYLLFADSTRWYRAAVKCGNSTVYSNPMLLHVKRRLPGGIYTISGNPTTYPAGNNFVSFNAAKDAMECGITDDVVFNVLNTGPNAGVFTEQLHLPFVPYSGDTATITFNGNGNKITFASTANTEKATIKLDSSKFVTFNNLVIEATGTQAFGVQLLRNADSNTFSQCHIITSTTATGTNYAGVVINGSDAGATTSGASNCDDNLFDRDTITGGYYGIVAMASTTAVISNNRFTRNVVNDFYNYGIYLGAGNAGTLVDSNRITRPNRATSAANVYGIYATSVNTRLQVSKNKIYNLFGGNNASTSAQYGINFSDADATPNNENLVANNLIFKLTGAGQVYGIANTGSDNALYYHNTIAIENMGANATGFSRGFYQTTLATGLQFKNNMVTITRDGTAAKHAIYLATAGASGTVLDADHNNYFVSGAGTQNYIGYYSAGTPANAPDLTTWKLNNIDPNSLSINPGYADTATENYRPVVAPLDNQGTPVGIGTDITNAPRSSTTPDIGAFEFTVPPCGPPTVTAATFAPSGPFCIGDRVTLDIPGSVSATGLHYIWMTSATGTPGSFVPITGDSLDFPQYTFGAFSTPYYQAQIICNGTVYLSTVVQTPMNMLLVGGDYTIDQSQGTNYSGFPGANFHSFNDAVFRMACGVTGSVRFHVAAQTFNERVLINHAPGLGPQPGGAVFTATFLAANGNASTSILSDTSIRTAATNYVLKIDTISYLRFRNLTIQAQTNATLGRAVEFAGITSHDSLVTCIITAPTTTNGTNTMAAVYANNLSGSDIAIVGNTITGGSSGINFSGVAGGIYSASDLIGSNTVSGSYAYGIYAGNLKRVKLQDNTVSLASPASASLYGIYATNCDTAYHVTGNTVNINNVASTSYGVYLTNCAAAADAVPSVTGDSIGVVAGNKIYAITGNTGNVYGLILSTDTGAYVVNNVIAIDSAGTTSYGLHSINSENVYYYNNSALNTDASATAYAAYFNQTTASGVKIRNNIFAKKNKGKAIYVSNPTSFTGDYNMLWATDTTLAQGGTTVYSTLNKWYRATNWDRWSISYPPAFVSDADLRPDTTNSDSWAMHGRGVQIIGNGADINLRARPQTLTAGVPDLGAYEFHPTPTTLPTPLTATPATPGPGVLQTFMYGTDTVMKIRWSATAPSSVIMRRYSGDVGPGISPAGLDSMFFYNDVTFPGGGTYTADSTILFYIDPWQGSIPAQYKIGLGRTTASNAWIVEFGSRVNQSKKVVQYPFPNVPANNPPIDFVDKFTGLVNPYAPPVLPDVDSSNRGRRFWTAYQRSYDMPPPGSNAQEMVLYFSTTDNPANVQVKINGTTWVRNYVVPPFTTVASDLIPKGPSPAIDPRLLNEGLYPYGISIESDEPITAYAHIYSAANSGATMLFPVGVWGYEYYTINNTQYYSATGAWNTIMVIADNDNTVVEITLSNPDLAGHTPGVPFQVTLDKGDVYQVLGAMISGSQGYDITGSLVKSVPNSAGKCFPIAVFSGTSRTGIGCGTSLGSSGDLAFPQVFPYSAWGKHYMTAPTTNSSGLTSLMTNIYRVLVKDPATVVTLNGVTLQPSTIINNRYYQFESNTADEIIADKPVLVAQYMSSSGSCPNTGGDGDPDVFIISPVEQAVKGFYGFYRNNLSAIDQNYMTIVLPNAGMNSLKVDGVPWASIPAARKYSYSHSNPNYTVATVIWTTPAGPGQSSVETDSAFTGVVFGTGSVESYGYNVGTKVLNLNGSIWQTKNCPDTSVPCVAGTYTCSHTPFQFSIRLQLIPSYITISFSTVPGITPSADVTLTNPVPSDSVVVGGIKYYIFTLSQTYTFANPGIYYIPIEYQHPDIESCDHTKQDFLPLQVLPSPRPIFNVTFSGCVGTSAQFVADSLTQNGFAIDQWTWFFHDGTRANGPTATYTYNTPGIFIDTLKTITADGCLGDTSRTIVVNPSSGVTVKDSAISVCAGTDTAFYVLNPDTAATYYWYTTLTGGTPIDSGAVFHITGVTSSATYYVGGVNLPCGDSTRIKVTLTVTAPLATPVVSVSTVGPDYVDFSWGAVPGATGYLVSIDSGNTWISPSSGAAGLLHHVPNLLPQQTVCIIVRAIGTSTCDTSLASAPVCATVGCPNLTIQVVNDSLATCPGNSVTFQVVSPVPGYTYYWYHTSGGSVLDSGLTFTTPTITTNDTFYVGASSGACAINLTMVTVTIASQLPAPPVVQDTIRACNSGTVTFNVQPPTSGQYYWYSSSTGGSALDSGTSFTPPAVTNTTSYWLEQNVNGCISVRTEVVAALLPALTPPVVTVQSVTSNSVTFAWNAVTGATGYLYTYYGPTPGSGGPITATTYTVTGLSPTDTVTLVVTALGDSTCQSVVSVPVTGQTTCPTSSVAVVSDTLSNCSGGNVTFQVQTPVSGGTYYWYTSSAGGSAIDSGTSFTTTVSATTNYWVGLVVGNCVSPRTQVTVMLLNQLPAPVVTCGAATINSVTFSWNAVAGATGYSYVYYGTAPGSGSTNSTSVTVTGLQASDTVTLIVTALGAAACQNSVSVPVLCQALPCAVLDTPNNVHVVDSTPSTITFGWNAVDSAQGYEIMINNNGAWIPVTGLTYTVTGLAPLTSVTFCVRAIGVSGCPRGIMGCITGKTVSDQVFIPNTFTPNGDGHNDVLKVFSFGNVIKSMSFMVFNQWGEKVFESSNPNVAWDGTFKGKKQPVGVYVYVGRFTLTNGNVLDKKGSINLVR